MRLLERGPQLAELAAHLAEARRSGGRLVLLSGEAGIGKTALLDAFAAGFREQPACSEADATPSSHLDRSPRSAISRASSVTACAMRSRRPIATG